MKGHHRNLKNQGQRAPRKKLDLVFIQDTTENQQAYIDASVARCKDVCIALKESGQFYSEEGSEEGLRLAVVAFRDHFDGDEYVTKDFNGFTSDLDTIVANLKTLVAGGGGDGPDAVTAALDYTLKLKWRRDAAKVAVVITDAPPHGIGEDNDYYKSGEPNGKDPLSVARAIFKRGIVLLIVACEPVLSNGYKLAHDFYMALAKITSGSMFPLTNTDILAPLIVGFSLEQVAMESLSLQFQSLITSFREKGMGEAELASKLFTLARSRKIQVTTLESTQVYTEPAEAAGNVSTWLNAKNTLSAQDQLIGALAMARVPEAFIPPSTPWPKSPISVTLKNLADFTVQYSYPEDGMEKKGVLHPHQIGPTPTKFLMNTSYLFTLKKGREIQSTNRTFTKDEDWDLGIYFD